VRGEIKAARFLALRSPFPSAHTLLFPRLYFAFEFDIALGLVCIAAAVARANRRYSLSKITSEGVNKERIRIGATHA